MARQISSQADNDEAVGATRFSVRELRKRDGVRSFAATREAGSAVENAYGKRERTSCHDAFDRQVD